MVSIARKNLFQDLPRFMVAQAGIMFAVGLVTIQTGLLEGFTRSSSLLIDRPKDATYTKPDLWIASTDMRHLELTLPIPYERVAQAAKVAGVERAEALIIRGSVWRRAAGAPITPIRLIGYDPKGKLFGPWNIRTGNADTLRNPYTVFIDRADETTLSSKATGDSGKVKLLQVGDTGEVSSLPVTVRGVTQGIRSVVSSPFVFTSLENASLLLNYQGEADKRPDTPPDLTNQSPISFILIKAKPGENLAQLKQRLEDELPKTKDDLPEIQVLTQLEMSQLTQAYWRKSTGVGFILGLGAVVGMVVGTVVVGQILYSSVTDHLTEFGTLKAMGAPDWYIYRVIIEQAMWMAVLGYIPGLGLCLGLGAWTSQTRAIQILINPSLAAAVLGMTVIMCSAAAIFAIQKVTQLDPAMVFKS
jgi:putative ABC transport system permease protein